jgi:hypothetical protein
MSFEVKKKMVIYEKTEDPKVNIPLRAITVHSSFEGINERGEHDIYKFRQLAKSLEPDAKEITITVMDL